ncbi:Tetratricopeptide repeat-domain-containing protein [Aspergillus alliaceus]|uniref:Tetratricopeptide repeat-domain-containing protein n=1 Tax=Petromyces alliaceus TaxID=209559 RepID=UPI0012A6E500|nr:Tetratricopeptide repeat-domain-containing protein [Aspergillus alliaceus]KAB8238883.1 Tetratricopeptide repeat-domain-containing protein [Aspergillus alliaceus]
MNGGELILETRKPVLGPGHPDTLTSMANLASTYRKQGRWKEVKELDVQALNTRKQVLGPEHPDTLTSMANLALTYWNQGRWKEAEELNLPDTLDSMHNVAFTLKSQGKIHPALALMEQCVELHNRALGPDHPASTSSSRSLREWKKMDDKQSQDLQPQETSTEFSPVLVITKAPDEEHITLRQTRSDQQLLSNSFLKTIPSETL